MSTSRTCTFERCALASGLLTELQLGQAWARIERSGRDFPGNRGLSPDEQLATTVIELGWINAWQAKQLSEGRTDFLLGSYRIIDYIGRGGMGEVYKAEHGVLGRVVAIKVLPRKKSTPEEIASFLRESRVLARLDHENLVRAFDAGEEKNVVFLVTEYVAGTDLRKLVRAKGPLTMASAASIISQVTAALDHAHHQGLVHRDVKPGNVLVTQDGRAKLSDLGLAGSLHGAVEDDPRSGKIVGTADYLSPDQIEAPWNPTTAWDVYSLGCTLYYSVTGKVPFPGGSTNDKIRAHRQLRPLDPRRLNPGLSDRFVDVIADMMAKNPAERIASAKDVAARLAPWTTAPGRAAPTHAPQLPSPSRSAEATAGGDSSSASSGAADSDGLEDTQGSLSIILDAPEAQPDAPGQNSQTTHPVAATNEETDSALGISQGERAQSPPVFGPFAAMVLFPLTVVALILFAWWLFRILF